MGADQQCDHGAGHRIDQASPPAQPLQDQERRNAEHHGHRHRPQQQCERHLGIQGIAGIAACVGGQPWQQHQGAGRQGTEQCGQQQPAPAENGNRHAAVAPKN
ncbi:MAG: hypothetical protein ABT05_05630 [Lautropia sp. SCN 66-9]|nr:MAG: hypothetical protein ABT05_05630 [Lautropia sp. SCN 66-9]